MVTDSAYNCCLRPLQIYDHKRGNIQQLAFPCSIKAVVSDCITTRHDKVPDFEVSCPENPAPHLEMISFAVCHQKSYTFHTFPSQLHFFPFSTVRHAFFMSGKPSYHFFLQSHSNHRLGHSSWQSIPKLQLTSLATEQTILWTAKREGCRLSPGPGKDILYHDALMRALMRAYQNNFG